MKRIPTKVFSEWAEKGRDEKMAKGHEEAVANMLEVALKNRNAYDFIDAGCGNGWVVRLVKNRNACQSALGVDGALKMIEKARTIDPQGAYFHADLMQWKPKQRVDIVHSMEVVYYLPNPKAFIKRTYDQWLKDDGQLIIGIDFYTGNIISHSWPEDCGVSIMQLLPEQEWISFFKAAGFTNVQSWRVGKKDNWTGTLVITGTK